MASICAPEADTLAELEHSRDADRLGFSPVPSLVTTGGAHGGFLFSLPIYKHVSLYNSIGSRRQNRLRQLGMRIAVDDFGTGYSSLSDLANYPISRVKITQELVSGVEADSRCATVVRAAIRLAHELGIDIIAEGIETEGQRGLLLAAGCEHGQGFYFSRPVDAAKVTELLRAGKIALARRPLRLVENPAA